MSLLDKATIITTPTAHSNGVLHSIKGGSVADFDVVRGSAATRVNAEGLIEDVATNIPRIDYTGGGCPSLLLEPQSTNLITYSEDFSDASWTNARSSSSANETISPSGVLDAYKLFDSAESNTHLLFNTQATTIGSVYSFSFFIKKGTLTKAFLAFNASVNQSVVFDLENGLVYEEGLDIDSSKIEDYGNDWFRCSFTHTASNTSTLYRLGTYDGSITYTGTGTDYVYLWGAQFESLPYSTSYIPTSGAIATRLADSVTGAGDATTFNSTEGVLYAEIAALANDSQFKSISLKNSLTSTYSDTLNITYSSTSNEILAVYRVGTTSAVIISKTLSNSLDFIKCAFKFKSGEFSFWVNGVEAGVSTNTTMLSIGTLDKAVLSRSDGASPFYGKVKALAIFNEALTDSELQCLTTI